MLKYDCRLGTIKKSQYSKAGQQSRNAEKNPAQGAVRMPSFRHNKPSKKPVAAGMESLMTNESQ
jgi:hypothetical protein